MSISQVSPRADSLVLYKIHPARVRTVAEKIEIELENGQTKRVRDKDIQLLHPGPVSDLKKLSPCDGDVDETWELLDGAQTELQELSELLYDEFSPASAWAAWQLVADGLYFSGTPDAIQPRSGDDVERDRVERQAKVKAEQEWQAFLERMGQARLNDDDRKRLQEVERLANGQSEHSRILTALGHQETPVNAHRTLVKVGYWEANHNPYPARSGVSVSTPVLAVPELQDEARLDLTHLPAYAIDDEGNQDPDDAISLDGDRLWIHVADVAALVAPDDPLDLEARSRGANLYLPEGMINMLPGPVTERLGLGLQAVSPALSIGVCCTEDGTIGDIEIKLTLIKVQRLSYGEVNGRMDEEPFAGIERIAAAFRARRRANGSASIDLPEVTIRVRDGQVDIRPMERGGSRAMVTDAMLMAGEAVARFCVEHEIPIPFATQPPPDKADCPPDLASMYAFRRCFKPSRLLVEPEPHAGLGLDLYTRVTSPLRRYSDLVVHQQLRAWIRGETLLSANEVGTRVGQAEAAGGAVRRAERLSNQHWKLVYLRDHPKWQGEAVVVENAQPKAVLLIPELALDARIRLRDTPDLNARVRVGTREVDLADAVCYFQAR